MEEVGFRRVTRFGLATLAMIPYRLMVVPPLRGAYLRLLGARIGSSVIIHDVRFFNLYRRGLRGLVVGDRCFLGDECLLDLAEGIELGHEVTLAERVLVLTHINVGYRTHPLQALFPPRTDAVVFEPGCFVGASTTILPGVRVGAESFVAAGSVVTRDVPRRTLVAGVPARHVRNLLERPGRE
jgi:acetyltransferase-like isoleucine patch superfamily enzyme